jgi:hypothetical protein
LFEQYRGTYAGRIRATAEIDGGILIGGAGAYNWYHFIVECLPKAFLTQRLPAEFDDLPLLVPEECRRFQSFAAALALFSGERELRYLSMSEHLLCNRLLVLDEVSFGPFNLAKDEWPRVEDYSQHEDVLMAFVSELRAGFAGPSPPNTGRRLFLQRPGQRRNYNQEELLTIAARYGFEPVSPETMTLEQQARMFAGASAVVGPSGAAWVGMIFRDHQMAGLSWLPSVYQEFCGYSALARLLGHELYFIEAHVGSELRGN